MAARKMDKSGGRRLAMSEEYEQRHDDDNVCCAKCKVCQKRLMRTEIIGLYWSVSLLKLQTELSSEQRDTGTDGHDKARSFGGGSIHLHNIYA